MPKSGASSGKPDKTSKSEPSDMDEEVRSVLLISDVHLTDRAGGDPVDPDEWHDFIRNDVERLSKTQPVDLVLLGDVIDILRSEKWRNQSKPAVYPWSQVGPRFVDFPDCTQAQIILDILNSIETQYSAGLSHLRQLVSAKRVVPTYIAGNHDYTVSLCPNLAAKAASLFGASCKGGVLRDSFERKDLGLYAEHGHRGDSWNTYDRVNSKWAIGDAIVLFLVNRVSSYFSEITKQGPKHRIVRALDQLDNIEPVYLIFQYLQHIIHSGVLGNDQSRVKAAWDQAVDDFAVAIRAEPGLWSNNIVAYIASNLSKFKALSLADGLALLKKAFDAVAEPDDIAWAHAVVKNSSGDPPRIVVMGHTHKPGVWTLRANGDKQTRYVNTGTWHRVVRPVHGTGRGSSSGFGFYRVRSYVHVVPGTADHQPRFELHSQCQSEI